MVTRVKHYHESLYNNGEPVTLTWFPGTARLTMGGKFP
jgi:hypothetical protein